MRRIDPTRFRVATRGTSRQINRQIALTLISSHQPISRADLARRMKMRPRRRQPARPGTPRRPPHRRRDHRRGCPRTQADAALHQHPPAIERRRRRPRQPHVPDAGRSDGPRRARPSSRCRPRAIRAASSRRWPIAFSSCSTTDAADAGKCEGIGVVVPGMVDSGTSRVLHAPTLGLAQRRSPRPSRGGDGPRRCTWRTPAAPARWRRSGKRAGRPRRCGIWSSSACRTASASASSSTARCCAGGTTSPANSRTCR